MDEKTSKELIKEIMIDENLSGIKAYMQQQSHSVDVLLLNHIGLGKWKEAKDYLKKLDLHISDGTWRDRQQDLVEKNLATAKKIDPLKFQYEATEDGHKLAELLLQFYSGAKAYSSK